ncbi:hypothetical protein EDC04DRAFT_2893426 [Pisolithus marmoratus]|nr:hypothetical protein EDC04DRAFT_2893426 [Pisolithus marmoratus]
MTITIHLLLCGSTCFRIFGLPEHRGKMEFKQHFLPYKETEYPSPFTFKLRDLALFHDGFVRERVLPDGVEVKNGSLTLSSDKDFAAIAYLRKKDDTRFWVLLSYYGGRHAAFAVLNSERPLAFQILANSNDEPGHYSTHVAQHIHFRRSIAGFADTPGRRLDARFHQRLQGFLSSKDYADKEMGLDEELMTMLLEIIDYFSVLVGWVDGLDKPKHLTGPVTVEAAITFFVGIFSGTNFSNFIGEIEFFHELPSMMEMEIHTGDVAVTAQAQRIHALAVGSNRMGWMTLWENGSGWRSALFATQYSLLGEKVVKLIATAYQNCARQDTKFDRHKFLSEVTQIKEWGEMLIAANNEHERRALVEDIVGKVTSPMTIIFILLAEVAVG